MWGAYLSGMWIYRLGLTQAKEHALTGRPLSGSEAADVGLINQAVPFAELEETVAQRAAELAAIPSSQLAAMKLVVNQAYENMGLASTQTLGPILDGLMRNTPDARAFIELAESEGVRAAVARARRALRRLQPGAAGAAPEPGQRDRALSRCLPVFFFPPPPPPPPPFWASAAWCRSTARRAARRRGARAPRTAPGGRAASARGRDRAGARTARPAR